VHIDTGDKTLKSAIFTTFGPQWRLPWPWIGSYGILSFSTHRLLTTQQILSKSEKTFYGRTDIRMDIGGV